MKLRSTAWLAIAGAIVLMLPDLEASPTISFSRPSKGRAYHAGQMFTVSGRATPPGEISAIRVRVAGQRLIAIGRGHWKVSVGIGLLGRHKIVVAAKIGNKVVAKAQRYVRIVP